LLPALKREAAALINGGIVERERKVRGLRLRLYEFGFFEGRARRLPDWRFFHRQRLLQAYDLLSTNSL
jgi:hypothetical protein